MANYLKGIGDAATRANEILPSLDARIYNFLCGHTVGIIKSEFYEFSASTIDRGVIIKSGLMQAHGYFGCTDTDTQINFVMPGTTQYCHLYAEIELSVVPNRFEVKATPMSNSAAYSFRLDNLRSVTNGKYQFHLWQVTLTSSAITLSDKRAFINKPLNAVNAELAADSLALANANAIRSGGVLTLSDKTTGGALGKLVCVPAGAKIEYKIPLLTKEYWFQKGKVSITIPNWDSNKTYEWNYKLNGNNPGGESKRVRGGEFMLPMSASGNSLTLFIYGFGTFSDGAAWDNKGVSVGFSEDLIISQIYEIQEAG